MPSLDRIAMRTAPQRLPRSYRHRHRGLTPFASGSVPAPYNVRLHKKEHVPRKVNDRAPAVEGEYQNIAFRWSDGLSPLQLIRNVEGAGKSGGFFIPYSDRY
jgi:hypothetical protein